MQDTRFRRALSLGIDRHEINEVVFFGLAEEGNDTVLPASPLFRPEFASLWAGHDPGAANALLDDIGLVRSGATGTRRLADGRLADLVVETAGEDPLQVAILELIRDRWLDIGIRLLIKPEQRELMRNRVFSGAAVMSVWSGLENALATPAMSPAALAPTSQQQLGWAQWGQYFETSGRAGEPPSLGAARTLLDLNAAWTMSSDVAEQRRIWESMLAIRAGEVFTLGTVRAVPQPVVVNARLRNVPLRGIFNWEPGAFFGVYRPDTFWYEAEPRTAETTGR
jgi:peptide/nickel transport system substrate-binding protein